MVVFFCFGYVPKRGALTATPLSIRHRAVCLNAGRLFKWPNIGPKLIKYWPTLTTLEIQDANAGPMRPISQCNQSEPLTDASGRIVDLMNENGQYRDRRKPETRTMPYSYFEWLQGFFLVHSTIDSTVHSMPLNSLEHCICTTTMTNIRPDRDSNLVPPD